MDALDLARWQFGITTVYHFLFVPLTIGLSVIVASLQTVWHRTGRPELLRATRFFGNLYLINTAMGVVTGLVQEFQFGMNWSNYATFVGDVFGAPLALEALLAFFLEATFLGLWMFGWDKLPRRVHLATIWAAAIGSNLSAYFILAANAWMRHPVGFEVDEATGRARMTDLWAVLTNPQAISTFVHVVSASFVVAGLFVVAVSAYRLLKHSDEDRALFRTALRAGLTVTAIAGVIVAGSGDGQAKLMAQYEPMKLAAAEAHWDTGEYAGFSLFAVGDLTERRNIVDIAVTPVLSFLATGSIDGEVQGVNDLQEQFEQTFGPGDYVPNVAVLYWAFRLMMGLGLAGAAVGLVGLWMTRKGREPEPWAYRVAMLGLPAALAANIFGWILTEMGRQPWTVVGELLTAASVSPGVSLGEVAFSLAAFTTVYAVLAVVEARLLWRCVKAGPPPAEPEALTRPMSYQEA
ncbi:cytochrome bd-I ubiquinol oxidase subunit 1 apoprotein [Pseudonocardia thermophila]|jgi:Cytochrome bd-type quinol oxidase, subunit 1|uniref:Cytochrome bd-I ubiquinol oxidase subunit 1 apoprotein n=1 Tax=Pseudonocardia thermophila TaxID=1848 RepID=A0A1M6NNR0_PSETH|nr:cytochrome ubiquinol oxidase subunit I [Pseudonocardia thermophila]SHJ97294.1 cytochrome bd-I ubiquinol oxidase subunit 1 apoprotein [Pseudonocardia thermophila]